MRFKASLSSVAAGLAVPGALFSMIACKDSPTTPPTPPAPVVASVTIGPLGEMSCAGGTIQLTATAVTSTGAPVTGASITWSSDNTAVATVDQNGLVTAVAGGTTTMRAAHGTIAALAPVHTLEPVIRFRNPYPSLFLGDTLSLSAVVAYVGGVKPDESPSSWASADDAVATVTVGGVVEALGVGLIELQAFGPCGAEASVTAAILEPRFGTNREITYLSEDGLQRVRSVFANGLNGSWLTPADQHAVDVAWSPDGERVIITYSEYDESTRTGAWVSNADGSDAVDMGIEMWSPSWSPDGSRIAFRNYISSGESDVYTAKADGTDLVQVTSEGGDDLVPRWSPDGRQLLYTREVTTSAELWLIGADGSGQRKLSLAVGAWQPEWSPDGRYVAFTDHGIGPGGNVWIVNADGTEPRNIGPGRNPAWSPDGSRIAFARGGQVVIANPDGTGEVAVNYDPSCCFDPRPRWSPDGTSIAINATHDGETPWPAIAVIGASGTPPVIVSGVENAMAPLWRP